MKTYKATIEKPRLQIYFDDWAELPRDLSNLGLFLTKERNYRSPDDQYCEEYDIMTGASKWANNTDEHVQLMYEYLPHIAMIEPISKYEHGLVKYSRGVRQGFDSGVVGFYFVSKERLEEKSLDAETDYQKIYNIIDHELKVYNQYANGEVYCFKLLDEKGEVIDSCGDFYDLEEIKQYLPAEWQNENMQDYLQV